MDYFVTSLDNSKKKLTISSVGGSAPGDLYVSASFMNGIYLISPFGLGNFRPSSSTCPFFKTCIDIMQIFLKNKHDTLETDISASSGIDFSFNESDIITFATPNDIPALKGDRLQFIKSEQGFFGIATEHRTGDREITVPKQENIVWLSGPLNQGFEQKFGKEAYEQRHSLFGHLYNVADANPPQMNNPIYAMSNGREFTFKGTHHAYHQ